MPASLRGACAPSGTAWSDSGLSRMLLAASTTTQDCCTTARAVPNPDILDGQIHVSWRTFDHEEVDVRTIRLACTLPRRRPGSAGPRGHRRLGHNLPAVRDGGRGRQHR